MTADSTTAPDGARSSFRHRLRPSAVVALVSAGLLLAATLLSGGAASADPSATDWQRLRQCESGGNYTANTGNGYYGAYQFDPVTWRGVGGSGLPHQASVATQDALALKLWQQRGWTPWVCAGILGLAGAATGGGGGGDRSSAAVGSLDQVRGTGSTATVSGWVMDPTRSSSATQVHVYVSAPGVEPKGYAFTTNITRTDVNQAFRVTGLHGFSVQVPLRIGANTLCAFAIGDGGNTLLGCQPVTGFVAPPQGLVDSVSATGLTARVAGWAYSPNDPATSIPVHLYVNGAGYAFTANGSRPDVNAVHGITGQHGFSASVPLRRGSNSVCTFAIGSAAAGNTLISCRDVPSAESPLGALDAVQVSGSTARVSGWTFDPATTASTEVHVYVNGAGYRFPADVPRGDVNAAYGTSGSHGYSVSVPLAAGPNRVCAFGIGRPGNPTNLLIGCRDVQSGSVARSGVAGLDEPAGVTPAPPPSTSAPASAPAASTRGSTTAAPGPAASSSLAPTSALSTPSTRAPAPPAPPAAGTQASTTTDGGSR